MLTLIASICEAVFDEIIVLNPECLRHRALLSLHDGLLLLSWSVMDVCSKFSPLS